MYAVIGIILIVFTIVSGFWLEKQQFNRRNAVGVQQFDSYGHMVKTRMAEGIIKALGVVFGLVGIGCIVAQFA